MHDSINHLTLLTSLIGGLALFLFGMDIMTKSLKQVAGASMKNILSRMTRNRFTGMFAGAAVTAIIQSSSITTVLLVGFVSAGLITTTQSVAVILGANIGTTITAQILAFKVTALALPLLSAGFFVSIISKRQTVQEWGRIFLGLGMVFFGMVIMSDAVKPLRSYQPFLDFMLSLDNVYLAALVGAGFTALIQSSSATTGILIVMAGQGLIGLEPAIALALGANVGTCVTALLATIGKPRAAVRTAIVHTLFNVIGVMLWIGFVPQLADIAQHVSPTPVGMDASTVIPRQLANVHTFFNLINALLFIGFTAQISRLAEWMVPDKPEKVEQEYANRYLDPEFLEVPAMALSAARMESQRLGQFVRDMLAAAMPTITSGSPMDIDRLRVMDRPVDLLHRQIVSYLRKTSLNRLPSRQSDLLMGLMKIVNDFEHIGDLVATGLVRSARKRIEEDVVISPATSAAITALHAEIVTAFDNMLQALGDQDHKAARDVRKMKAGFAQLIEDIASHEVQRLQTDEPNRLRTYAREIELTETLDDIFKIIRRIARTEIAVFKGQDKPEP